MTAQLLEGKGSVFNQVRIITLQTTPDSRNGFTATQPGQNLNSLAPCYSAGLRLLGITDQPQQRLFRCLPRKIDEMCGRHIGIALRIQACQRSHQQADRFLLRQTGVDIVECSGHLSGL
ncbi:hypothetical protein [Synechococcus sp. CS-197]|uniref:hypothetical protein n=1 Tax=Synechococcus sp. CS-197 TaxID=2847985 RepID=UPI00223A6CD6|nr:hypothetical protein [Synechococcus sp. CS-197]